MTPQITICSNAEELAERAADLVIQSARESIAERRRFHIALAGGSTPEKTYKLLAQPERSSRIDWQSVYVFFGDERFVRADDSECSNYAMAKRSLLGSVPIPAEQIFPFDTSMPTIQEAAWSYSELLERKLGNPPVFDLVLLGMGDDGHTASLFPHSGALEVTTRWAVDSPPGILPPPVDRMTVTYPVINSARHVLFLIAGEKKAQALRDILEGGADRHERPSAGADPQAGKLTFLIDQSAASLLTRK